MIKRLYKRIRLYSINKNIKKLQTAIESNKYRIDWIKAHILDIDVLRSTTELNNIKQRLEFYEMMLDCYKQEKERIEAL